MTHDITVCGHNADWHAMLSRETWPGHWQSEADLHEKAVQAWLAGGGKTGVVPMGVVV